MKHLQFDFLIQKGLESVPRVMVENYHSMLFSKKFGQPSPCRCAKNYSNRRDFRELSVKIQHKF
ncbi:hypothetical protein BpHYR1_039039 [Brachionus plicatilis]|uniref:Uncharacterized protein n=1 Tax=Brachionus plicatilis TaxID=10195 RepID=A0A3M7R502_BRAPC|nr:hypothetical protein BpHYR1_039039 [Brachionus plicatilis]